MRSRQSGLGAAPESDQSPTSQIAPSRVAEASRTLGLVVSLFGWVLAAPERHQSPTSQMNDTVRPD